MKKMSYAEAIREAMSIRMREDPNVLLFGEDVGAFGGCFGVSAGMFDEFGEKRVRDTPISEGAIIGAAVGSAATGLRPIAELMFCDFLTVGMDQLVNQAAKMRYMFGGKISLPMVVRLPCGAGVGAAAQHSQSLEAWMTHVPGLKVVYPSCAEDALGLMLSAIDDDNPVMYFENKTLMGMKSEVNSFDPIPLGKGKVLREGEDLSIITYGKQVYDALEAAEKLVICKRSRWMRSSATKVPLPRLRTTSPSSSSSPMACRTVLRLIFSVRHSSASLGSRSPTASTPVEILRLIMPTSWA
mgnify:CR=1 FL=1